MDGADARGVTRRALMLRGGALALALTQASELLRLRALLGEAQAADPDTVRETISALVAFVMPGPDAYSVAQGEQTPDPGGVDGGVPAALTRTLDAASPPLPVAQLVADLLNSEALQVAPTATAGGFASHFARLSMAQKSEVFRRLTQPGHPSDDSSLGYLALVLLTLTAQHCYGEAGVFDRATRTLTGTPVGWRVTGYTGPSHGSAELVGYWKNHSVAVTAPEFGGTAA
jgi:hypothetical protein